MTQGYATPQDAEDAFYDALEESNLEKMLALWEDSDEVACLLPMQPLVRGRAEVARVWEGLIDGEFQLDLSVTHLHWVEAGELAIHFVEEQVPAPDHQPQPPLYGMNIYRRGPQGWRMLVHQNSPAPPPEGRRSPDLTPPGTPV